MERFLRRQMPAVQSKDDWTTKLPRGGLRLCDVSFDADRSSYGHIERGATFRDDDSLSWSFIDDANDNLGSSASLLDDVELEMAFEEQCTRSRACHIVGVGEPHQQHTPPVEIPGRVRPRRIQAFSPQARLRKTAMWRGKERRLLPRRTSAKEHHLSDNRTLDFDEEDDGLFKMEF